jgi:hypothetical protein
MLHGRRDAATAGLLLSPSTATTAAAPNTAG